MEGHRYPHPDEHEHYHEDEGDEEGDDKFAGHVVHVFEGLDSLLLLGSRRLPDLIDPLRSTGARCGDIWM